MTETQDLLVPLYRSPALDRLALSDQNAHTEQSPKIQIRKVLAAELPIVGAFITDHFSVGWQAEFTRAANFSHNSGFVACMAKSGSDGQSKIPEFVGFACYDGAAKGLFGPIGVARDHRGKGLGLRLLSAALIDMRAAGYAYAIIGGAGPVDFYKKAVGAIEFPGGAPGYVAATWQGKSGGEEQGEN